MSVARGGTSRAMTVRPVDESDARQWADAATKSAYEQATRGGMQEFVLVPVRALTELLRRLGR